jgi:hypothetical protein
MAFDRIPRCFRKAYNLPLSPRLLTASCHLKPFSNHSTASEPQIRSAPLRRAPQSVFGPYIVNPFICSAPGAAQLPGRCVFLLFEYSAAWLPRPRNFDTRPLCSYCYELQPEHRLETSLTRTPPPICAFAQGSQTALIWRAVGAANG